MSRNQLQMLLKINGYTEQATDDEIRSVLSHAKYSDGEIEQALLILRQHDIAPMIRSDGLHTVFYTDNRLRPSEIAGLLGVDVRFDPRQFNQSQKPDNYLSSTETMVIIGLALVVALVTTLLYMYFNELGFFHSFSL